MESLSLEPELIRDVHHPLDEDGPHRPVEVLLPLFYVERIDGIAYLSGVQKTKGLCLSQHIEFG